MKPRTPATAKKKRMKNRRLTTGVEIPYLGCGLPLIADEAAAAVSEAIRAGYRHVDSAGGEQNESRVGAGPRI